LTRREIGLITKRERHTVSQWGKIGIPPDALLLLRLYLGELTLADWEDEVQDAVDAYDARKSKGQSDRAAIDSQKLADLCGN
jgi:hypothetical protein